MPRRDRNRKVNSTQGPRRADERDNRKEGVIFPNRGITN